MIAAKKIFEALQHDVAFSPLSSIQGRRLSLSISNAGGDFYAFVDDSGSYGLWVPLGSEDRQVKPDVKSRDIILEPKLIDGASYCELKLRDKTLSSVFFTFVDTYLKAVALELERAATCLSSQLVKWRALFTSKLTGELTEEKELGLIAELQVLKELWDLEGDEAFYRWTGPEASRHDFQFPDRHLECKATRSSSGLRIKINGDEQLTRGDAARLLLVVKRYEKTPNGKINLRELVQEFLERDDVLNDEFLYKLSEMGYAHRSSQGRTERRYNHVEDFIFDVGEEFPRLQKIDLPPRIVQLTYTLDLTPPIEIPGYLPNGGLK